MTVPDPRVGTELARYRIDSVLGRGGMSVVYLAEHTRLGRKVALKLLSTELSEDQRFRDRFLRESRLAASLDHPNVIPIYEADEVDGVLFIAMRYVAGTDLKRMIHAQGRMAAERALSILGQIAEALDAAHEAGLVHRDVKPANILIAAPRGRNEHAYLADFGLTKRAQADSEITVTGQFVGTVDYIAPEQIEGRAVDGRTDVYSFGCVLYEALTGTPPFPLETDMAVLYAHLQRLPPKVSESGIGFPAALDQVIARAMAKRMEDRYPNCGDVIAAAREALGWSHRSVGPPPTEPTAPSPGRHPARTPTELTEVMPTVRGQRSREGGHETEQLRAIAPARGGRRRTALLAGLLGAVVVLAALRILFGLRPGNHPQAGRQSPSASARSGSPSPSASVSPSPSPTPSFDCSPVVHPPPQTPLRTAILDALRLHENYQGLYIVRQMNLLRDWVYVEAARQSEGIYRAYLDQFDGLQWTWLWTGAVGAKAGDAGFPPGFVGAAQSVLVCGQVR